MKASAMFNDTVEEEGLSKSDMVFPLLLQPCTGIQSPLVSSRLLPCLEEAWPVIFQAAALDAVPMNSDGKGYSRTAAENNIWI
ncbi:hypothetical protein LWI29_025122 [Acer saccharum]|uniref:Uncharacterized protein n=1 Tax=Acer saccharum TaxID=4024 RepID=A0AA39T4W3_ACESA|nr:hypothetical protein LWI29_025122 [Acer saccharum]